MHESASISQGLHEGANDVNPDKRIIGNADATSAVDPEMDTTSNMLAGVHSDWADKVSAIKIIFSDKLLKFNRLQSTSDKTFYYTSQYFIH